LANYRPAADGTTIFDVPLRMRAGTNPGGPGMDWVRRRFVDPDTRKAESLFVRSLLQDNPSLDQEEYTKALHRLNPVDRERLLNGDWDVVESGDMFDRADFRAVEHTPKDGKYWVRYWDLAATSGGGDYTVGALCCVKNDNTFHVEHIVRLQGGPRDVENIIRQTAMVDGVGVHVRMEQEPGSSGKTVIDHYARNVLAGYNYDGVKTTGDKVTRATAFASYVRGGYVSIKLGRWNTELLDEMQLFPRGAHDDQVDAVAGAFNHLMLQQRVRIIV
jgi:predicted phage terminase large subunit-like protein